MKRKRSEESHYKKKKEISPVVEMTKQLSFRTKNLKVTFLKLHFNLNGSK